MIIVGAKGLAKEVLEILHQNGETDNLCFYDDVTPDMPEKLFDKFPILRNEEQVKQHLKYDNRFIIGIGNPKLRKKIADKFTELGGELTTVISTHAEIGSYNVQIEQGCIIMGGVRISNDVKIGRGTLVYYNSVITHDVRIGNFVEVSPGGNLLGRCTIEDLCHIAAGSIIFPDITIGKKSIIAAGSVVRDNVPDNTMVAGIPAIIKKQL